MKFSQLIAIGSAIVGSSATKIFMDNDEADAATIIIPLAAGIEIVGISGSLGSSSYVDSIGSHANFLEEFNLTECIPLYGGAAQPLLLTNETFHIWEELYGALTWEGAWSSFYEDTYTFDNFTYDDSIPGAVAMINAVKKYKDTDPVTIFSFGTMTTVAQALSLYPDLVKDAAGLYIMGGYFDAQYVRATGNARDDDLNSDINLYQDPEAAQIVLTADWNRIIIGANVTNFEVPSQEIYDRFIERAGSFEEIETNPYFSAVKTLLATGNFTENTSEQTLPFWDSVAATFLAHPDIVKDTIDVAIAVDTSYASPFYGNARFWSHDRKPTALKTGNATYVTEVDLEKFYDIYIDAFFQDFTQYCDTGAVTELEGY